MIFRATDGIRGKLIDLDTGKVIPKVVWFDDSNGTFEAYRVDEQGEVRRDHEGEALVWWGRGNLKFVQEASQGVLLKPKRLVKDRTGGTRPKKVKQRHEKLKFRLFDVDCGHCACLRPAEYAVSDEEDLPPSISNGRRWARAKTVKVRYFCAFHYEPPRILDAKGEVMSEWEEAGGVRPQ